MSEGEKDRGAEAPGTTVVSSSDVHDAGAARPQGAAEPTRVEVRDAATSPTRPARTEREGPAHGGGERRESSPPGYIREVRDVSGRHKGASALAALLLLLLLVGAVGGTAVGVLSYREAGRAKASEAKAVEESRKAREEAAEYKGKFRQSEATWKASVQEARQAQAAAADARRSEEAAEAIQDFLKKTLLSAGRPGDGSLSAAFWAAGQGNDVTLRKALDSTETRVAGTFADRPLAEAAVREMLGLGYLNVGESARAIQQYERALALREATQGPDHPDSAACRNQLAVAYRLANKTTEAGRLFERDPDSSAHAAAMAARAGILLREKKFAEAELRLRESLTIRRKLQPEAWTTFDTQSALGEALLAQGRFADAEKELLPSYEGLKRHAGEIPTPEKSRVSRAIGRLVRLYDEWGKPEQAAKWRAELQIAGAAGGS